MADPTMQQVLARLEKQDFTIAALGTEVATLRSRRRARHLAPLLLVAFLLALTPLTLFAANFQDLNPGSAHNANINTIADAGITKGCTDTQHYCPNDYVTREQMASFLARTAGLGGNPAVTNAATLGGRRADGLVRVARTALPNNLLADPPQPPIDVTTTLPAFQTVGTVAIVAPSAGFVIVTAQSDALTSSTVTLYLRLRDATSGEVSPPARQHIGLDSADPVRAYLTSTLTPTYVFPVAAVGPRTFVLEATTGGFPSGTYHQLYDTTITALFIPFGHDGGTSLAP